MRVKKAIGLTDDLFPDRECQNEHRIDHINRSLCSYWPRMVEHKRFELLTPTMPLWCATNCANAPRLGYITTARVFCKDYFSRFFDFFV